MTLNVNFMLETPEALDQPGVYTSKIEGLLFRARSCIEAAFEASREEGHLAALVFVLRALLLLQTTLPRYTARYSAPDLGERARNLRIQVLV